MSWWRKARYIGPLTELKGKTALVRKGTEPGGMLAQFDGNRNGEWRLPDEHKLKHPKTGAFLCYNWHPFPKDHFEVIPK